MKSGSFQVGETITGTIKTDPNIASEPPYIQFRAAVSNHKEGPHDTPTRTYGSNPYTDTQVADLALATFGGATGQILANNNGTAAVLPDTYSSTSTILNVDTVALANQPQGDFYGYIQTGMTLKGGTSGAEAEITNLRFVADFSSTIQGSFFIPNPNVNTNPTFTTGQRTFVLADSSTNDPEEITTTAADTYDASGSVNTVQENVVSVRNARVQIIGTTEDRAVSEQTGTEVETDVVGVDTTERVVAQGQRRRRGRRVGRRERAQRRRRRRRGRRGGRDPLAQSFFVSQEGGVFVTSCDVYFESVDDNNIPVTFQIRTIKTGLPTTEVLPFSEVNIDPDQITTSSNGSVATKFTFESPVYLEGGTEYALVMLSSSLKYRVFISRIGENDLITDEFVSNQPVLGSLFKSQNASTWEPSQWEDLKFDLFRASFVTEGSVELYNPILSRGNAQVPKLMPDSLRLHSKKVRVGLSSGFAAGIHPTLGNTIYQQGSNVTGNLTGTAGIATGSLTVTRAGIGYTSAAASIASRDGDGHTVVGVALSTITGSGQNAIATIEYNEGSVINATITGGGQGYQVGDVLGITTALGINGRLSVVSIASTNELIIDNVQGAFLTGAGTTLMYGTVDGDVGSTKAGVGSAICGNGGGSGAFIPDDTITTVSDGLHITVNHKNHGMYHEQNLVTLSDVASDIIPTKLSVPYNNSSTDPITVDSVGILTSFENVAVAATNPGYIKVKNEIIKYTGVSAFSGQATLTGVTRAQDSTSAQNYVKGDLIQKYELGGVSLRRINRTHDFREVSETNPITLDSYKIKVDMGEQGIGRSTSTVTSYPALFLNQTKSTGGFDIHATQNMPFEVITPMIQNMTVSGTAVDASIRTVSGTSINDGSGEGTDVPFINQGDENIAINEINYLNSPRVIASRVNELNTSTLTVLPGDRSFNMTLNLSSSDNTLSPVIDSQRMNAILTTNRIDRVVSDVTQDSRVDTLLGDPSAATYISKENTLETSATSIKIIVDAHVNKFTDIRAFYAVSESEGFEPIFVPFPGFDNLDENGRVRTSDKSSGKSDALVPVSDPTGFIPEELQYREYTFTANELPSFKSFRIKFMMTSTNQAHVPRLTSLKVIATA